jgi:hypothetical protein
MVTWIDACGGNVNVRTRGSVSGYPKIDIFADFYFSIGPTAAVPLSLTAVPTASESNPIRKTDDRTKKGQTLPALAQTVLIMTIWDPAKPSPPSPTFAAKSVIAVG